MERIPRRTPGGFTLVEILVVLAILSALMAMVASAVSRAPAAKNRLVCTNNLRQLGALFLEAQLERGVRPIQGPGWLLQFLAAGAVKEGDERVFLCPNDPAWEASGRPGSAERYRGIDLARPPADLCSYVVRDWKLHPLRPDSRRKEPLAACLHHADGAAVLYADGTVLFLAREALGLGPGDPIEAGPRSPAEALRVFPVTGGAR